MSEQSESLLRFIADHPGTPLFARVAAELLDLGDAKNAWDICKQGIRRYPSYVSGYFVTARAAAQLGRYGEAGDLLRQALELAPWCVAVRRLLDELPNMELHHPAFRKAVLLDTTIPDFDTVRRPVRRHKRDIDMDLAPDPRMLAGLNADAELPQSEEPVVELPCHGWDSGNLMDELDKLAEILETARIPRVEEEPGPDQDLQDGADVSHRPATETLAGIYVRQGRIDEAVDIYATLAERDPDRREYFVNKISGLRENESRNTSNRKGEGQ
jgi:tetratricopeptide (TPR) repeat protein